MKKLFIILTLLAWLPLAHANQAEYERAKQAFESQDYGTAFSIWERLGEQGHVESQFSLALTYALIEEYAEAVKWYSKAAKQGHLRAQIMVAQMYRNGNGVPKNFIQSYMWFSIAIANGLKVAGVLESLEEEMTPEDISKAQRLAKECWESKYQNCDE